MRRYAADALDDVRFAFRQFRRQPRYWTLIALTLVIGIAASTSLFAIVDGVLLKPLPYSQPDRLVRLTTNNLRGEYALLRQRARTMDIGAYYPAPREVTLDLGGRPARLPAAGVTADLFDILGVQPVMGRGFTANDMRTNGPGIHGGTFWRTYGVVIVSNGVWREHFAGRGDVIGRDLVIESVPHTVVGVMPPGFHFPSRDVALWFPHNIDPADLWAGNVATMIGRLRGGYTVDQARLELRTLMPGFRVLIPWGKFVESYGRDADVQLLSESIVGGSRRVLLVLLAAIGVVLLVLCVNVANLLLARGLAREREMVTRAALGAHRARLARQVIVENLTISVASGVAGVLMCMLSLRLLLRVLPPDLPRIEEIGLDARIITFALVVSAVAGLAFGLLPALRASRAGRGLLARGSGGVVVEARERYVSSVLASVQFAFAVVLATSAVLLLQSLWNLLAVDPGFRLERLVIARASPPGYAERPPASRHLFQRQLLEELRGAPAVESAALANAIPFDRGLFGTVFQIEGRSAREMAAGATYLGVTAGYFETMATPVVEGRGFTDADGPASPRVALINQRTARGRWGDASPIGARIRFTDNRQPMIGADGQLPWFTIVGVVGDTRFNTLTDDVPPMVYIPLSQAWDTQSIRVVVKTAAATSTMAAELSQLVSRIDRTTAVSDVQSYQAQLGATIARPRFAAYLLTAFAFVTVFLAAVGTYGVLSHAMSRRIREIGVRLAFGASGHDVFGLLFRHGMALALAGLAMGIPAAAASTRFLSALLFGVESASPLVFAGVAGVLLLVGLFVSYVPASRARYVDPMVALRCE